MALPLDKLGTTYEPRTSVIDADRARAYAATGSFLAEEPFCTYRPDLEPARPRDSGLGARDSEVWVR